MKAAGLLLLCVGAGMALGADAVEAGKASPWYVYLAAGQSALVGVGMVAGWLGRRRRTRAVDRDLERAARGLRRARRCGAPAVLAVAAVVAAAELFFAAAGVTYAVGTHWLWGPVGDSCAVGLVVALVAAVHLRDYLAAVRRAFPGVLPADTAWATQLAVLQDQAVAKFVSDTKSAVVIVAVAAGLVELALHQHAGEQE